MAAAPHPESEFVTRRTVRVPVPSRLPGRASGSLGFNLGHEALYGLVERNDLLLA